LESSILDFRPFYWFVFALAAGAGAAVGWVESSERRGSAGGTPPGAEVHGSVVGARSSTDAPRAAEEERETAEASEAGEARTDARSAPLDRSIRAASASKTGDSSPVTKDPRTQGSAEELQRLEQIRSSIVKGDLDSARLAAAELTASSAASVAEEARRLEARAQLLERLAPDKAERGKPPSHVWRVHLANGQSVEALDVEAERDRWIVRLTSGAVWRPKVEEVVSVEKVAAEPYLATRKAEIDRRVSKLDGAVDLYHRGVVAYFREGLGREGFELLDRLLGLPDAAELVRAVGQRSEQGSGELESLLALATRGTTRPPAEEARSESPPFPPDAESGAELVEQSGESPSSEPPRAEPKRAIADPKAAFETAGRLVNDARKLYRGALRQDGHESEMESAYDKLREAQDILEALPSSQDGVPELRREVGVLLFDVSRALPF
jgi:hypothetical protein